MERKLPVSGKRCVSKPRQSRKRPGCIRLFVCPTTGGRLEISVSPRESILGLKTALARKLRTNPARITLIYKEKALTSGRLIDYQIPEDSLLTLLPNMESGLSLHQSEKSITQALENLSDTQVNDFLSGRAPLMLAIRMGENMVFVQLQLSTVQGQGQAQGSNSSGAQHKSPVTSMTPRTATLLSQSGLSASALAQATRCLSRRFHHIQHGMGKTPSTTNSMAVNPNQITRATVPVATVANLPSSSTSSPSSSSSSTNVCTPTNTPSVVMTASAPISPPSTPQGRQSASGPATATTLKSSGPSLLQLPTASHLPPQNLPSSTAGSSTPSLTPPPSPGAVIDSLKHVGSGVYSGTFSGTLDPSLQEANGQPRKSVNTILHILNDLLVASPSSPRPRTKTSQPTSPNPSFPSQQQQHSKNQQQSQQIFFNQNSILTPPASPKLTDKSDSFVIEKDDNKLLRGKMQRVQMMLAQRKEQRGKRRQAVAPYPQQRSDTTPSKCCSSCSSTASPSDMDLNVNNAQPSTDVSSSVTSSSLPTSLPTSSSSSSTTSSNATSEHPRLCSKRDEGGECCSSYGQPGLEHDSLVV